MKIMLGLDIGASTTKIAAFTKSGNFIAAKQKRPREERNFLQDLLTGFIQELGYSQNDLELICMTGVGATEIGDKLFGIPTTFVQEFEAVGRAGLLLTGKNEGIVISIGTGTVFIRAKDGEYTHIGGTGIGGGTLMGLGGHLLHSDSPKEVIAAAAGGDLSHVDLTMKDICAKLPETLPAHVTASNFGKVSEQATTSDLILGLLNMIFQAIGMLAVFASKNDSIKDIILTGALAEMKEGQWSFDVLQSLYGINFTVCPFAVYAGAIGAVAPYLTQPNFPVFE